MANKLPDFFKYNLWANRRLLEACAQLSDAQLDATAPGTYGSIRATLQHLFAAEEGYANHFTKAAPSPRLDEEGPFSGFDELHRRAEHSGNSLISIAEQGDLDQVFYLDGGTYKSPAIIVLIQALDHGIDHRSQIATLMSIQNIEPPCLDAWCYNDENGEA
jgi:uncharacterized damage-inducible protein DinB